jgi:hypothetical protein
MAETVELDERALQAAAEALCLATSGPFEFLSPEGQEVCRAEARAAIRAYLRTAGLVSVPVVKE